MLWLLLVSSLFAGCIDGEIISVRDATPEKGFPQTLTFYVKRGQHNVKLFLQENNRKRPSTAVRSKQSLVSKLYQDFLHDGSFEVSLTKQNTGQYLRTLTGNFKLNGELVQIKPTMVSRTQRTRANTWTPYILLTNEEMRLRNFQDQAREENLLERYLSSHSLEGTAPVYSIQKRIGCKDIFSQCKNWLNDYYQNNRNTFCGRDMFESWCCETCKDWNVAPAQCEDDLSNCREMLQDDYNNDFDAFCPIWDKSCCATCSGKPEDNCVDKGYLGLTCQELLDWAVHGNMVEMCKHYDKECCAMCSGNGNHNL